MFFIIPILLILIPSQAFANVVWPGLFVSHRMVYWSIPVGVLIEFFILKKIIRKKWSYIFLVTLVTNIISTFFGILGTLFGTLAYEFSVGSILYKFFHVGTFNPLSWTFAIIIGTLVSTIIEVLALRLIFKIDLNTKQRYLYLLANFLSTLVAFVTILIKRSYF
jgi:hypothetical protein